MARTNTPIKHTLSTHEGGAAWPHTTPEQRLRRSVLSCLLWEDEFYEDGESIAQRISDAANAVTVETLAALAVEARSSFNLRHVPMLLLSILAKRGSGNRIVRDTIAATVQRADELAEFLAVYAKLNGVASDKIKKTLSAQVKKGLARAFAKFDAYALAKYDREGAIKLRDVLFMVHAKPKDADQKALWAKLIDGTLESPDTWEVALSGGSDKRETFERLLREEKLGYLALLRNLRNMVEAKVDRDLIVAALAARKGARRVLPFRYVAAAQAAPSLEPAIDAALVAAIAELSALSGLTAVLVDVSGSMAAPLSAKSDLQRVHAGAALASIIPGQVRMFSFSDRLVEVPPRKGMAGVDAIIASQTHNGTALFDAVHEANERIPYDRIIVITDEQANGGNTSSWALGRLSGAARSLPAPKGKGYMINVASAQNGVGYGPWVHIDGFSEHVLRFIHEHEQPRE